MSTLAQFYYTDTIAELELKKLSTNPENTQYSQGPIGCPDSVVDGKPDINWGSIIFVKDTGNIYYNQALYGKNDGGPSVAVNSISDETSETLKFYADIVKKYKESGVVSGTLSLKSAKENLGHVLFNVTHIKEVDESTYRIWLQPTYHFTYFSNYYTLDDVNDSYVVTEYVIEYVKLSTGEYTHRASGRHPYGLILSYSSGPQYIYNNNLAIHNLTNNYDILLDLSTPTIKITKSNTLSSYGIDASVNLLNASTVTTNIIKAKKFVNTTANKVVSYTSVVGYGSEENAIVPATTNVDLLKIFEGGTASNTYGTIEIIEHNFTNGYDSIYNKLSWEVVANSILWKFETYGLNQAAVKEGGNGKNIKGIYVSFYSAPPAMGNVIAISSIYIEYYQPASVSISTGRVGHGLKLRASTPSGNVIYNPTYFNQFSVSGIKSLNLRQTNDFGQIFCGMNNFGNMSPLIVPGGVNPPLK